MTKHIVIVGAGRVGIAAAKIASALLDNVRVTLIDCRTFDSPPNCSSIVAPTEKLQAALLEAHADVVLCCTPFFINPLVAKICAENDLNYVDFTEDNAVTAEIAQLDVRECTFVPQTGLAPGLITYIGLSLFDRLREPHSLSLRVGALPQVSFGPEHYAMTWSVEGLVNEYFNPAVSKVNGIINVVPSLTEEELIIVNGRQYEGFTTSGGVGMLSAYEGIPNVQYKTLRHPGHASFAQSLLNGKTLEQGIAAAKKAFKTTRDDVVVMAALATDIYNQQATFGAHFYSRHFDDLTALELTTAGTGVAVAELILAESLPFGVLDQSQIQLSAISKTAAGQLVIGSAIT
jgi:saccharopine dehydrogenase-like NADP-dependent oxidoreductase